MKKNLSKGRFAFLFRYKKTLFIMKNLIIFLVIVNLNVTANSNLFSQEQLCLDLKNVSLKKCLKEIDKQTKFGFLYNGKELNKIEIEKVKFTNTYVVEVLDKLLNENGYTYEIFNDVLLVRKAKNFRKETNTIMRLDTLNISGIVTDQNGEPLPGVSIHFKSTPEIGTATDINGKYTITKVLEKHETLVFSFIGFKSQLIEIEGQSTINTNLEPDLLGLEEVVVTGYSSISRERATGSFIKLKSEDITQVHHLSIEDKMKYNAPGVLISTQAGDGGEELVVEMRGKSTLKGTANPLLVIDGFPTNTTLSQLNPNDIETINILQDAAAASIWGARAANGVIVISTKKGSVTGAPQVEFSYTSKIYESPRISDLQMASSQDLVDAYAEIQDKGMDRKYNYVALWGDDYYLNSIQQAYYNHETDPVNYTLEMRDADLAAIGQTNVADQYEDLMLQTGVAHDANFNIRGGNESMNYFLSYNYQNSESVYVGDSKERNNITLNNGFQLHDRIKLNTGINLLFDNQTYNGVGLDPLIGNLNKMPVYQLLQDENGNNNPYYSAYSPSLATMQNLESRGFLPFGYNPYQTVLDNDNERSFRNTRINADLTFNVLEGLDFQVLGMYEKANRENRNYSASGTYNSNRLINQFSYFSTDALGNEVLSSYIPKGGRLDLYQYNSESYTARAQLNYDKTINNHQINALVGAEFREVNFDDRQREEVGYDKELGTWQLVDYELLSKDGVITETGGPWYTQTWNPNNFVTQGRSRYASYYLNAAYTYQSRYTLTFSGRIDDGSMFGVEASKRRTPLWSVGGSWNITEEDFFNISLINRLKLRLTYGKNGNVNNSYSAYTILAFSRYLNWTTGEPYASISNLLNPDLKWETTTTTNAALDFALFKNNIWGTFEYYYRKSTDVLATFNINVLQGASTRTFNNGEIVNNGFTLQLSGKIGNKFEWTPGLNISYNKNEVTKAEEVSNDPFTFLSDYSNYGKVKEGYSIDEVFGFHYAGLDANGDPQIYDADGSVIGVNDPVVTDIDAVHSLGVLRPKYWGAFTNSFKFKNFALHAVITYKLGHIFEKSPMYWNSVVDGSIHESVADRWQQPGDEDITDIPAFYNGYNKARCYYYDDSDVRYLDAGHIRLQDISLTYDIPKKLLKNIGNVQLRAQVSNIGLLWTANDEGIDPEYVPYGYNNLLTQMTSEPTIASRPGAKLRPIYSFGIKLNF